MDLDEAIKHAEEVAKEQDKLCKRYDDASGYTRSHNEDIRTTDAKKCAKCAEEYRQLAEWLKELKAYKETWNKLGMWLADTRLAIAPDEFLNDVDEELVRVAQVDMIDTVLEWMDKQEVKE